MRSPSAPRQGDGVNGSWPLYVPGSPLRDYGADIAEQEAGTPAWVHGRVVDVHTVAIPDAESISRRTANNLLYAVQDDGAPSIISADDSERALTVPSASSRPACPTRSPTMAQSDACSRQAVGIRGGRAHSHRAAASGYRTLVTHIFDAERYLDSDTVFAVKPSLIRRSKHHHPGDRRPPAGIDDSLGFTRVHLSLARAYRARLSIRRTS